jgi:hypothetical protein
MLKKLFMGDFWTPPTSKETQTESASSILTKEELALLFSLIKNSNFKGSDIELVYNLVIKLQDMYVAESKK